MKDEIIKIPFCEVERATPPFPFVNFNEQAQEMWLRMKGVTKEQVKRFWRDDVTMTYCFEVKDE